MKDGSKFKGIFHGASTEGDLGIALKLAQKTFDPAAPIDKDKTNPNPIKNTLMIFSKDLVEINAIDVDLSLSEHSTTDRHSKVNKCSTTDKIISLFSFFYSLQDRYRY